MSAAVSSFALLLGLWCGWVCGRSHERHHHRVGSVLWFRGSSQEADQ